VLDRLISGAGALTDRADRLVRHLTSDRGPNELGNRPGSVIVIVLLIVATVVFGLLAIEATDNPTPRTLAPGDVASADDLGKRTYVTIGGTLDGSYVENYEDADADNAHDPDETTTDWYYFLVDERGRGLTVRSTRTPDDIYRYTARGILVRDPEFLRVDLEEFADMELGSGLVLEESLYIDAAHAPPSGGQAMHLGGELPDVGALVKLEGTYIGYVETCSTDPDGDGECEDDELDLVDMFLVDPGTGRAITIIQEELPKPVAIEFTGMLRDDPTMVIDARTPDGVEPDFLGDLALSDRYLLDDQATPANGALSLAGAILAGLLAAILAVGLAGDYLVFRRSKRALPSGARTLDPGEAIPVRVTGSIRQEDGLLHVREADAQLVRWPLELPSEPPTALAPEPVEVAPPVLRADVPTTLIVERRGRPEGVALGRSELKQLMSGRVMCFRGQRPALRLIAGTGTLLLSFDSKEARDRAAGELIGESALLIQGSVAGGAR
jgi:hypothetical protein